MLLHLLHQQFVAGPRKLRINQNGGEPVIGVISIPWFSQKVYSIHLFQVLPVEKVIVPSLPDPLVNHLHLSTTHTGQKIAHPVVIPDLAVLVVGSTIPRLCCQKPGQFGDLRVI